MQGNIYYSAIAKGYDSLHAEEQLKKAELLRSKCCLKGLLLDIGSGTCVSTGAFVDAAKCIVALEPSLEMLKQCDSKGILRVCGKAEQLPFPSNCFDSIVSLTALHHADLKKALAEIRRVAKKDAVIAVSFFKRANNLSEAKRLFEGFEVFDAEQDWLFIGKKPVCRQK